VTVASATRHSLAAASRYSAHTLRYPRPSSEAANFDAFLMAAARRRRYDVLLPVSDVITRSVIANQAQLRHHTAFAVPPIEAFETVTDKARLADLAIACGVPAPDTQTLACGRELAAVLPQIHYPVVVKSFRSRIPTPGGWIGTTAHYASTPGELEALYRSTPYLASFPSLIQRRVVGPGVGLFALCDHGRIVSTFAHRRLREKPPSGGVSVLRESVAPDPELVEYTRRLLEPLGWHGVAMVEFKRDLHSGRPFLIEVNGRFWGSLQLAIDSGVDFPRLVASLAAGERVDDARPYRIGVKSRWLLGDLDHLLLRLRGTQDRDLPPGAPSRVQAIFEFLKFGGRDLHYEVLRFDDPQPFLYEAGQYARSALRAAVRVVRQRVSRLPHVHPTTLRSPEGDRHARALR
jgi:predicted ATP-grasp superfamily ATP-dependent carboligase